MDKNTIVGLLMIFVLFIGFAYWSRPSEEQIKAKQEKNRQDSLLTVQEKKNNDTLQAQATAMAQKSLSDNDNLEINDSLKKIHQYGSFYLAAEQKTNDIIVETDKAKYVLSGKGGVISKVELANIKTSFGTPLVLFDSHTSNLGFEFMQKDQTLTNTQDLYYTAIGSLSGNSKKITGKEELIIQMRTYPTLNGIDYDTTAYLEWTYFFKADNYKVDIKISLHNMESYLYANHKNYTLNWNTALSNVEKSYDNEHMVSTIYYHKKDNDKVDNLDEQKEAKTDISTSIEWVSFKQQFFTSVLIAKNEFENGFLQVTDGDKSKHIVKNCHAALDFPLNDSNHSSFEMSMYFGPNKYKLLKEYNLDLERQVSIGWGFFLLHWTNRFVVIPIFDWLENYGLNYGLIILILTVIIKLILFPVAYKTYFSSAKMRVIKPEVDELNAKYPNPNDAMKKQQAIMQLYKKAGINPMSGCIPMLLQMPILIALFRFFPSSYELRQQPFLWADDLSTYDSICNLPFNIPFYGDHISLFCLLMTIATLLYTWLNNKMMATSSGDQQKMMKIMMYIMPILFLGMFNSFASGLTYYYLLVNLITFLQMFIFRYAINEKKLLAKIQLQKNKPVVKSKWQIKMEELAKQQQRMQQQQRKK